MTIYYTLTFMLLAAEMATFAVVLAPLPFSLRKKMLSFLSTNFIVAKIAYGLKISFIFVFVLFVDAMQRMWRIVAESDMAKKDGHAHHDARTETNLAARKFYAQRNTYLTGFCLFLSLILTRTFYILLDQLDTQEQLAAFKKAKVAGTSGDDVAALRATIASLQKEGRDFATLKKQARQQADEYDRLARELNAYTGGSAIKKD